MMKTSWDEKVSSEEVQVRIITTRFCEDRSDLRGEIVVKYIEAGSLIETVFEDYS